MNLQQTQYSVKNVVNYTDAVRRFLSYDNDLDGNVDCEDYTLGGVLNNVNYTWLSNGSRLIVLNTTNGAKIAAWNFGSVLRDLNTKITCVVGVRSSNGKAPLLVVGLQSGPSRGMICIFDVTSSKVIRAIQIEKSVTSIYVVDDGCGLNLGGVLHPLDGILAVGTVEGKVLLIDLCRQTLDEALMSNNNDYIRDEITACDVLLLSTNDIPLLERHKELAIRNSQHICIQINEVNSTRYFTLKEPGGNIIIRANMVEVKVSALYFCPQLGSLLVGYNFGAVQIYNLLPVKLDFTHLNDTITPVSHFAFQEPCDDPRAFCYLWIVYSNIENVENENVEDFPLAVMYALSYNTKEFLEGYGTLYQEIVSFSNRFQTHLKTLPFSRMRNASSGHCVSLQSYSKGIIKQNNVNNDTVEDRIALCSVVWTVTNDVQTETYMGLFDLNQWYKEQMPTSVKFNNNSDNYILFTSLSDLLNSKGSIIDVHIDSKTIMQFTAAQRLEEHYHPSSLSYKLICARTDDLYWIHCPGVQRFILSRIDQAGPLCLLRPYEIFHNCLMLGLLPLCNDAIYNESTPIGVQREMILSIALEHQLISWLCRCASEWSNGSQSSSGCTLEFLLNWAWQRANQLKTNATELYQCLFDHSGLRLDSNAHILFNHCTRQIKNLVCLYSNVVNSRCLYDTFEIHQQLKALQMTSVYFEVLQWLLNVGLLPECPLYMYPRTNEPERISAPYPVDSLIKFYQDRRLTLFQLQGENTIEPSASCDLLFIDNLIDLQCGGNILHNEWQHDGGNGLYPPPSLQACLRTYLVNNVDIVYKHSIFIYLFLDLAMTLDQDNYSPVITHLIKFPAVFRLSPSIIKITQAFWQLDHGDFSTAMSQLLDPLVNNDDLHPWHHRVAVKSLLAQGQHQHALLYHQVRKPPMSDLQDLCITITLLIVNDLLQEAFHFQRQQRSECNEMELLQHFMEACDKTNQLVNILQLPLSDVEEKALMIYLQSNRRDDTENLMVIYYLHRSRYAEAINKNQKLNDNVRLTQGLLGQQDMSLRNAMIMEYRQKLPSITRKLLDFCTSKENVTQMYKHVTKPLPTSVYVHENQNKTTYKSSLIQTSMQKIKQAWNSPNNNNIPFVTTPKITEKRFVSTPKRYPTVINLSDFDVDDDDTGSTPDKLRRISKRQPIGSITKPERQQKHITVSASTLLSTPITKRRIVHTRVVSANKVFEDMNVGTPQSILKVRKLVNRSTSPVNRRESDESECDIQLIDKNAAEIIKSSFVNLANYSVSTPKKVGISSRQSLQRSSKQNVRFVETRKSSTSSDGLDDVFYLPNMNDETRNIDLEASVRRKRKLNDSTVKARRGIKEVWDESFSPILPPSDTPTPAPAAIKKTSAMDTETSETLATETGSGDCSVVLDTPLERFPKVSARKSLTRKVLEQNTITKALSTPVTRLSFAKQMEVKSVTGTETTRSEKTTSFVREISDKVIEVTTEENKEAKNVFSTETDPVTLEQTTKHKHNESYNKSSTKLTEMNEDYSDFSTIDPILTSGSDVDESLLARYFRKNDRGAASETIFSIDENLDSDFDDTQDDLIEEFQIVEERVEKDEEKAMEVFEITDDLSDEDVAEINFKNTIEINTSPRTEENIVELQSMEPENYIEPDFEEEVGNVLSEESNVEDVDNKTENTDGNIDVENVVDIIPENDTENEEGKQSKSSSEDEDEEEQLSTNGEPILPLEDDTTTSEEEETESSEEEKNSNQSETDEESEEAVERREESDNQVIEIDSSSSSQDMDQLNISFEEQESVGVFEKNITHFEPDSSQSSETTNETSEGTVESHDNGSQTSIDSKASTIIREEKIGDVEVGNLETIEEENENTSGDDKSESSKSTEQTSEDSEKPKLEESMTVIRFVKKSVEQTETEVASDKITIEENKTVREEIKEVRTVEEDKSTSKISKQLPTDKLTTIKEVRTTDDKSTSETSKEVLTDKLIEIEEVRTMEEDKSTSEVSKEVPTDKLIEIKEVRTMEKDKSATSNDVSKATEDRLSSENKSTQKESSPKSNISMEVEVSKVTKDRSNPETFEGNMSELAANNDTIQPKETNKEMVSKKTEQNPILRLTRSSSVHEEETKNVEIPMKRGRKQSTLLEGETRTESPGRRGRKPSVAEETIPEETVGNIQVTNKNEEECLIGTEDKQLETKESTSGSVVPKKRGRKPITKETLTETREENAAKDEESSVPRRMTRRQSVQQEEEIEGSSPGRMTRSRVAESEEKSESTPIRKTRRSSIQMEEADRSRRSSVHSEERLGMPAGIIRRMSLQSDEGTPEKRTPVRRGRRPSIQSLDETKSPSIISDGVKSENILTRRRRTRKASEGAQSATPVLETIEEYASTHRLTRRQKHLIEENIKLQGMKQIDPIQLMDKKPFEEKSSEKRKNQEVKDESEEEEEEDEEEGRPKRTTSLVLKKRRISFSSDVSIISTETTPQLRHRSLTPTLLTKDQEAATSTSKSKQKGKTLILRPAELSKIFEEENATKEEKRVPAKRGRPRKTQPSTSAEEDSEKSVIYTAFKPRTSFKPKKSLIDNK